MSADDLICKAFDKGWNAGAAGRSKAECPFAPSSQEEKWQAWMIGYEEAYERYAIAMARDSAETACPAPVPKDCQARAESIAQVQPLEPKD